MGEIETVEAEKMGWLDLSRGTSYPVFPYIGIMTSLFGLQTIHQTIPDNSFPGVTYANLHRGHEQ